MSEPQENVYFDEDMEIDDDFLESDEDERNLLEEEKDLPIEEVLQRIYGDKGPPQDDDGVKFTSRLAQEIYNGLNEDEDDEEYNDEE